MIGARGLFNLKYTFCRLSHEKGVSVDNFFTTIQNFTELNDFRSVLSFLREKEKAGEIVLYAGTYSIEMALERFGNYDSASFYIYTTQDKKGYHIYLNIMGSGVVEDHKLFRLSHRYLYNKNYLSNCFFGEKDYRCGEFFNKKCAK